MIRLIGGNKDQMSDHDLKKEHTFYNFNKDTTQVELSNNKKLFME